ncbi:hypothetical protein C3L33_08453, partial [Rhododendron williamsianum]
MGYVLRVRFASFFAGAAVASAMGLYLLRDDYKAAHRSISQQVFFFIIPFFHFYSAPSLRTKLSRYTLLAYNALESCARSSCNQFYLGCEQKEVYLTTQGPPTLMKQVYIALVLNQEEGIFNKTPQIAIFPIACVDQRQSLRSSLSLMKGIYESLDGRVSVLEKLKEAEATKQVDAAE